jgi:threonine dehydratase
VQATRRIWDVMKIIVEPSGAVAYTALVEQKIPVNALRVGLVLSGSNLDLERLPWMRA